jgi:hypothetical protein
LLEGIADCWFCCGLGVEVLELSFSSSKLRVVDEGIETSMTEF